jgi:pyridoxine 5-phosphate synthase
LYTEAYARAYAEGNKEAAVLDYKLAASTAKELGLGINAGHDLDRFNLTYLIKEIPYIDEVSIGHALICDALYLGLENTIQLYKRAIG